MEDGYSGIAARQPVASGCINAPGEDRLRLQAAQAVCPFVYLQLQAMRCAA
jgi:hypothetical protein